MSTQPHIDNGLKTLISSFDQIFLQNSDQPAKEVTPFREAFCNTEFDDDEVEDIINDWITSFINSVYIIENLKSFESFQIKWRQNHFQILFLSRKSSRLSSKGKRQIVAGHGASKGLYYDIQDLKKKFKKLKRESKI